ncbi:hypothetical protein Lpp228_06270 [Lacticaseibacillus paracasei subsp. paracasei Lpp228]|uniref:Uncharacterized protein n=4 Tax=Lactobacillaceae TaxID=33958 RepID=A0A2M8MP66_LIMFE|nr:hypothetical protein N573_003795 [Limosilactobacillus fermentum 3872]AYP98101.1 hypothetical protein DVR01_00850 [Limosilactobacillus fermentum]EEX24760.1 hypothetical protein HMPREF0513_01846 [Limosilactobacillus fermentum 28-3-CHN]EPC55777.1 hypothetical protein Lpp189_15009 [Lacticaseibacillus paracasei subsp. paracasei Lpp189]EPC67675.1 hypothetical protein Lpp228_06270 [Lacticaseibacillus paracasei subsp. paracasei Lpp228]MBN2960028.1 hypothetical protein [Streptococcus gordonii]QFG51
MEVPFQLQDIIPVNLHERNPKDFKPTKPQMVAKLSVKRVNVTIFDTISKDQMSELMEVILNHVG